MCICSVKAKIASVFPNFGGVTFTFVDQKNLQLKNEWEDVNSQMEFFLLSFRHTRTEGGGAAEGQNRWWALMAAERVNKTRVSFWRVTFYPGHCISLLPVKAGGGPPPPQILNCYLYFFGGWRWGRERGRRVSVGVPFPQPSVHELHPGCCVGISYVFKHQHPPPPPRVNVINLKWKLRQRKAKS